MTLVWASGYNGITDPDAQTYIAAVEAADGQAIEGDVALAINDFVVGCKTDGIWDAIKASCILAGARTLSGALVPLKGAAPTNNNFVAGNYNRETGLVGNATTKYLNSNRAGNADPQDDIHLAAWVTENHTPGNTPTGSAGGMYVGNGGNSTGASSIGRQGGGGTRKNFVRSRNSNADTNIGTNPPTLGLFGMARSLSTSYIVRTGEANYSFNRNSESPPSDNYYVFARNDGSNSPEVICNGRLSFYSIGENLDLALLDNRVSTLMTDIGAAIP